MIADSPTDGTPAMAGLPTDCLAQYEPTQLLGKGGFGSVWKAVHRHLGEHVAIKVLRSSVRLEHEQIGRFVDEARITASLRHPNIVVVKNFGHETGVPWIAYELLDGQSLREQFTKDSVSVGDLLDAAIQVAEGLAEAHAHGVIHRDVKPDNILAAKGGTYKITDFGIARWSGDRGVQTATGLVMGTPTYMAPELIMGQGASAASDQYALGVMLYELIAGVPPFDGTDVGEILQAHLQGTPVPLDQHCANVPAPLGAIVGRMVARNPAQRWAGLKEVAEALRNCAASPAENSHGASGRLGSETAVAIRRGGVAAPGRSPLVRGAATARAGPPTVSSRGRSHRQGPSRWAVGVALTLLGLALGSGWILNRPSLRTEVTPATKSRASPEAPEDTGRQLLAEARALSEWVQRRADTLLASPPAGLPGDKPEPPVDVTVQARAHEWAMQLEALVSTAPMDDEAAVTRILVAADHLTNLRPRAVLTEGDRTSMAQSLDRLAVGLGPRWRAPLASALAAETSGRKNRDFGARTRLWEEALGAAEKARLAWKQPPAAPAVSAWILAHVGRAEIVSHRENHRLAAFAEDFLSKVNPDWPRADPEAPADSLLGALRGVRPIRDGPGAYEVVNAIDSYTVDLSTWYRAQQPDSILYNYRMAPEGVHELQRRMLKDSVHTPGYAAQRPKLVREALGHFSFLVRLGWLVAGTEPSFAANVHLAQVVQYVGSACQHLDLTDRVAELKRRLSEGRMGRRESFTDPLIRGIIDGLERPSMAQYLTLRQATDKLDAELGPHSPILDATQQQAWLLCFRTMAETFCVRGVSMEDIKAITGRLHHRRGKGPEWTDTVTWLEDSKEFRRLQDMITPTPPLPTPRASPRPSAGPPVVR